MPLTKTKIVCTMGPASVSTRTLAAMIRGGMSAARINFSHGAIADHLQTFRQIRRLAKSLDTPITVIQDLSGVKIRIGDLASPSIILKTHRLVTITTRNVKGNDKILSTNYINFAKDVKKGDRVLLDDGKIELKVLRVQKKDVVLRVMNGGIILPHKGINLPGVKVSAPSLTEKDKNDLAFAFEHDVDYVALSFVRKASDVVSLREFIIKYGPKKRRIPIIVKIERGEAINNIDEIIREADAVMVARGDLGVELPTEDVPLLQKMIVRKCNENGKPVIIATQMLESMIQSPVPTRAEASDVANAVLDGADAVMLSAETSIGKYPVQAVGVMKKIICRAEKQPGIFSTFHPDQFPATHRYDPLCRSACMLAEDLNVPTIVSVTHTGTTAMRVAKYRPYSNIVAVIDREKIARRLNIVWGVHGLMVKSLREDTDTALNKIEKVLVKKGFAKPGDNIVTVAGIPLFEAHSTNTIKVDRVEAKSTGRKGY